MGEITALLVDVSNGDEQALHQVFEQLHGELKRIAVQRLSQASGNTLTPTVLVNELFLKLSGSETLTLNDRRHFFACAATAMRQIMVDAARAAKADKRGGQLVFVTLTEGAADDDPEIIDLDQAMDELELVNPGLRELVDLRFFAGLPMEQIAELRETSLRSLHREWARARAFLHAQLQS